MTSQLRTVLVFGSGPGIGISVATNFASHGFDHIILLSRNAQRLEEDRKTVAASIKSTARIDTVTVDLSDQESLKKALQQIDQLTSQIEVVFFNAARVGPSPLLEFPIEDLETDFRTTTVALYTIAKWAMPKLQELAKSSPQAKPSLLVMSGLLHIEPVPDLFSLSLVKAAQRNLVQSLHAVYQPQDIHVGLVLVGGEVSPEMKELNPTRIAEKTWELFDQDRAGWELEVKMLEP